MIREPLMLSDTAMVLLREIVARQEADTDFCAQLNASPFNDRVAYRQWSDWKTTHRSWNWPSTLDLIHELTHEIWLQWTFPDIPIVRHLDWHLTLNDALMNMAEETFLPLKDYRHTSELVVTKTIDGGGGFSAKLFKYYRDTVRMRASASKDNSGGWLWSVLRSYSAIWRWGF